MFTVEIAGRAVAVTNAYEAQARELIDSAEFREDLTFMCCNGQPVWDGHAEIILRPATDDEEAEFDDADDPHEAETGDENELSLVFLVDLDDDEDDHEKGA